MNHSTQIANRVREVFLNGQWVAKTNYKELLADLLLTKATITLGNLNSIALLVFHVNYYLDGLNKVFQGGQLTIKDKYSFDMPPLSTESEWLTLKETLLENAIIFADLVENMDYTVLTEPFVREEYGSNLRNIEATIEHGYYHLGQIAFLKKLLHED